MADEDVSRVEWEWFLPRIDWRQGEHVSLVGPTGQGKTTLGLQLVERRSHVALFASKPADRTLAGLTRRAGGLRYRRLRSWAPNVHDRRVLLWPPYDGRESAPRQAAVFGHAIESMLRSGGWCIVPDDTQYLTQRLNLRQHLVDLWLIGRSVGLSVVAATQRPRWAPVEMFSQSSHLFLWGTSDDDDLRRLAGLGQAPTRTIRRTVERLAPHDVLYVDARRGGLVVTRAPARLGGKDR